MSKAKELLLECKIAKGVTTDYQLADALQIRRQRISEIMKTGKADEYACFRIAEALHREPSEIIAEIRAETDKRNADFWRDFLQRRGLPGLAMGALLLTCSGSYTREAAAAEMPGAHNGKLRQRARYPLTTKTAARRFFFGWNQQAENRALEARSIQAGGFLTPSLPRRVPPQPRPRRGNPRAFG